MNYQPLGDQLLLRRAVVETTTRSGVIKGELATRMEAGKAELFAEVVAIGDRVKDVKVGDKVLMKSDAMFTPLTFDGVAYGQVYEYGILGKQV